MSAAEVIANWLKNAPEYGTFDKDAVMIVDALKAAGYAVVELPSVAHKGPHDTDAKFFRQVAERLEIEGTYVGGSNVRRAASLLLRRAADASEVNS